MNRKNLRLLIALLAMFSLIAAAGGDDDDDSSSETEASTSETDDTEDTADTEDEMADTEAMAETGETEGHSVPDGPTIRVRGQDFPESVTIAQVYGQYLAAKGYDIDILTPAGFRAEAIDGITNGEFDLIIDYIGGALTELAPDEGTSSDPDEIVAIIDPLYTEIGATLLEYSPAVNGDAMVVRGDFDGDTISDLVGADAVLGASAQCFERPQCFIGYTDPEIYGIEFAETTTIEYGPLLGEALAAEEVDAVVWEDTTPLIAENGFKILEDDMDLHPAQNIAPIVVTEVLDAYGDQLATDLNDLSAAISTDDLQAWGIETDINFRESDEVAAEWLAAEGLI